MGFGWRQPDPGQVGLTMKAIPVVISTNGFGVPVVPVTKNAPKMTVAENGLGLPIIPVEKNAPPFVIEGYTPTP